LLDLCHAVRFLC
jgi:hypothetical protein